MDKVFKLVPFSTGDRNFVFRPLNDQYNLMGYIVLEKDYDIEKMKQNIIERGVKRFRKMRSIVEYKNFNFWWKELPLKKVLELNPFEEQINKFKFDSLSDFANFAFDELKTRFRLTEEMPYKFVFIKNNGGNYPNLILFKADHLMSDGLGFV